MESIEVSFKKCRVLCLGDVMLDRFVYGTIDRISPEAPVPILKMNRDFDTLGGAGNVVRNLSSLGCQVTFVGIVGKDDVAADGAIVSHVRADHQQIVVADDGRVPLVQRPMNRDVLANRVARANPHLAHMLGHVNVLRQAADGGPLENMIVGP